MQKSDSAPAIRGPRPLALTIAGSDSGGGAGIQADLRTFAAFGVHGLTVITAVTAQNTLGVEAIHEVPRRVLRAQMEAVFGDFRIGAIKIGMLGSAKVADEVATVLESHANIPLILDPVFIATTGAALATAGLDSTLRAKLFDHADLLTPNIPEAERLLGRLIGTSSAMQRAGIDLLSQGARAVLLKGGHLKGNEISDLLCTHEGEHWFRHRRIRGETHGTGCSLSAAIAAGMARGASLESAVETGIEFVHKALLAGYRPGRGKLRVLDHMAATR